MLAAGRSIWGWHLAWSSSAYERGAATNITLLKAVVITTDTASCLKPRSFKTALLSQFARTILIKKCSSGVACSARLYCHLWYLVRYVAQHTVTGNRGIPDLFC